METDLTYKRVIKVDEVSLPNTDSDIGFVFKKCSKSSNIIGCTTANAVGGKQKGKKKKNSNNLGEVVVKKNDTYYRSNLKTTFKELNSLRFDDDQLRQVKKSPFWLLFNSIYGSDFETLKNQCGKNEEMLRKIILCYDSGIDKFVIGGMEIKLSKLDVNLILGVSGGEKYIPYKVSDYKVPNWIKRCFHRELSNGSSLVLYKNVMYDKLKETLSMNDEDCLIDVGRLTHSYLLAAVLASNQNTTMPTHLTQYIEDFDNICEYDWCGYILEMLLTQIASPKNLKVGGCAIILSFWLCEHTSLIKPKDDTSFPRFLKWDIKELSRCLSRIDIGERIKNFDHKKVLKPTIMECETFASLHSFWSSNQEEMTEKETGSLQPDSQATEKVCVSFQPKEDVCTNDESSDEFVEDTFAIATPRRFGADIDMTNNIRLSTENKTSNTKNVGSNPEVQSQLVDESLKCEK